ncbi:hypothetical protein K0C01_05255 [Salinarchaeum sp. IM2453]|uniref:hypothetical protein n=1 Tax=Salinarchaeum sp. IM2453 TaxID=2862870 RepID=UPI001C82B782|nr:hypothetical protein [Salinarchaeum sp. IM2453]QZA89539.1 hypothetical protein K0C01_05255 [Salinarchaeum sp. IM2453]
MKLNDINSEASEAAFGFKATSSSLKPVHLAQVVFSNVLESTYEADDLFNFVEKPGNAPSSELAEKYHDLFESSRNLSDEQMDNLRLKMRKVLDNDNALYASTPTYTAMTGMSDWFIHNRTVGRTPSRFIHTVIKNSSSDIGQKLTDQLRDHHDAVSLLFRPLVIDGERDNITVSPWKEPALGDAFEDQKITNEFVDGFGTLSKHLKDSNGEHDLNFARDLRRTIKFAGFMIYVYMANRHNEIREDKSKDEPVPLVLNYTGNSDNPVADVSLESFRIVGSEIQLATRLGVRHVLDRKGYRDYSKDEILREIENNNFLELNRRRTEKIRQDHEKFEQVFRASRDPEKDSTFHRLVDAVSNVIHDFSNRFDTYTPQSTAQTLAWRAGLLKPRGNRANKRRFRPDPEMLEPIILSVVGPGQEISLQELSNELRERYGIIVGGTEQDRAHLAQWDVRLGASAAESDPLNNQNYDGFRRTVSDLGYADEYADGVTIISTPEGEA